MQNRLMVVNREGSTGEGSTRHLGLYRDLINNKVLLYTTGNFIWYPVINQNGKIFGKVYIY